MKQKETKQELLPYKPKMRVQLLTEEGAVLSDRLVDQAIELAAGPKVKHDAGIKIEFVASSKQEIDLVKNYLDILKGELPFIEKQGKGRPGNTSNKEVNSPREEILQEVETLINAGKNQDQVIKYLRELGFVFMLTEDFLNYFPGFEFKDKDTGTPNDNGQYLNSLSWMVRRVKFSKDPKTDKYDPQIIFGFSMIKERSSKVSVYLYKERKKPLKVEVPKKNALAFNNTEMTKFPTYMREDERLKFSTETRALLTNESKKASKFYLRWYSDVIYPNGIKENIAEAIKR